MPKILLHKTMPGACGATASPGNSHLHESKPCTSAVLLAVLLLASSALSQAALAAAADPSANDMALVRKPFNCSILPSSNLGHFALTISNASDQVIYEGWEIRYQMVQGGREVPHHKVMSPKVLAPGDSFIEFVPAEADLRAGVCVAWYPTLDAQTLLP